MDFFFYIQVHISVAIFFWTFFFFSFFASLRAQGVKGYFAVLTW